MDGSRPHAERRRQPQLLGCRRARSWRSTSTGTKVRMRASTLRDQRVELGLHGREVGVATDDVGADPVELTLVVGPGRPPAGTRPVGGTGRAEATSLGRS